MAAPQLGRAQLEEKDRDDLAQIATALGIKGVAKATRESLIGKILEETMVTEPKPSATPKSSAKSTDKAAAKPADKAPLGADGEALAEWEVELAEHEGTPIAADARVRPERSGDTRNDRNDRGDRNFRDRNSGDRNSGDRNFGNRNET